MKVHVSRDPCEGTAKAADCAAEALALAATRNVIVAGGNTPLPLYAEIARRGLDLGRLTVFALDEYVGVPAHEQRTCANLIRREVVRAWGIPESRYHTLSSRVEDAQESVIRNERRIEDAGGLDLAILGLGRNGHIGFNEPGAERDSPGRVVALEPSSVEANRAWFEGAYAPAHGVTTGLKILLAARKVLLLAFGRAKAPAVLEMTGEARAACPASWFGTHPDTEVLLDREAASLLHRGAGSTAGADPVA